MVTSREETALENLEYLQHIYIDKGIIERIYIYLYMYICIYVYIE